MPNDIHPSLNPNRMKTIFTVLPNTTDPFNAKYVKACGTTGQNRLAIGTKNGYSPNDESQEPVRWLGAWKADLESAFQVEGGV